MSRSFLLFSVPVAVPVPFEELVDDLHVRCKWLSNPPVPHTTPYHTDARMQADVNAAHIRKRSGKP